jgi:hypothetical protein
MYYGLRGLGMWALFHVFLTTHMNSQSICLTARRKITGFSPHREVLLKKNVAPGSHGFGVNWELFSVDREQRKK